MALNETGQCGIEEVEVEGPLQEIQIHFLNSHVENLPDGDDENAEAEQIDHNDGKLIV